MVNHAAPRRKAINPVSASFVGLVVFFALTGGRVLDPGYVDWLIGQDPIMVDRAMHYLGWEFFRHSPVLQFPLGANPAYGSEISSSIVFTDSIPLLALLLKPFDGILPEPFQYSGFWILTSFCLQAVFAWKILFAIGNDRILALTGCVFFALAPPALWRLTAHYALFAQWVLLAGLYLYVRRSFSGPSWYWLLAVTALIHAYLLFMVAGLFVADLLQRRWLGQTSTARTVTVFAAGTALTVLVMWAVGYFMVGAGVEIGGFGYYRMNLLAPIDPDSDWSILLRDQRQGPGDYGGFSYLGLGMLGLMSVGLYETLKSRGLEWNARRLTPLVLLSLCLYLLAISNHIAIGDNEIVAYGIPVPVEPFARIFRAAGRMFWSVFYIMYTAAFYVVLKKLDIKTARILCVLMLLVQVVDMSQALARLREMFTSRYTWSSPLTSPVWTEIAARYKHIVFVPPKNEPANWVPLVHLAASNGMTVNAAYFGRADNAKIDRVGRDLALSLSRNELSRDALYVFEDDPLWTLASGRVSKADLVGEIDGLRIIAPDFR